MTAIDRPAPRLGKTLYRYLANELIVPTCFALAGLTLIVLTKDLMGYSELVINRGAGFARVAQLAAFQALPLITQMLPFAVLLGGLIGLGRMSDDLETLAMSSLGTEARQLIAPVSLFGVAAAIVGLTLSLGLSPWANRGIDRSLEEIAAINPAADLSPGVVRRFGRWKLEAREVSDSGRTLGRVLLWIPSVGETVFSESGELRGIGDGASVGDEAAGGALEIELTNGTILLDPRKKPRAMHFEKMVTALPRDSVVKKADDIQLSGLSQSALAEIASDPDQSPRAVVEARSELHRRFVLPVSAALFGILAVPLTLLRAGASRSSGAVLGLAVTVAYYGMVQLAEGIAQRNPTFVVAAAWLPNIAMLVVIGLLYRRLAAPWASESGRGAGSRTRSRRWWSGLGRARKTITARRWPLSRYVAGRFLQLSLVCFGALVAAYLLVDILERLQWFARHSATVEDILRFYAARIPLLTSRVVPMGLLVAMALTVSLLTREGELVGMRACGISAPRALRPALLVCLLIMPASFFLNDQIVPRTNELADLIKQRDIKGKKTHHSAVWRTTGRSLYQLQSLDLSHNTANEVVLYELGADGLPERRTDARSARYVGSGRWRLRGVTSVEFASDGQLQRADPSLYAELGDRPSDELDLMHLSVREVREMVREFRATGDPTTFFEVDLHLKLATPLACLLLPALVLVFAVSGPPFPSSSLTLVLAGALSIGYTLAAGAFASFGRGGVIPSWLGGWGPSLIATLALVGLLLRSALAERSRR
jgi:LPS export ABC transporter permease LptG